MTQNYLPKYTKNNFPNVCCAKCRKSIDKDVMFYYDPFGSRGQKMFCSMVCWNTRENANSQENQTNQNQTEQKNEPLPNVPANEPKTVVEPKTEQKPTEPMVDFKSFVLDAIKQNNKELTASLLTMTVELIELAKLEPNKVETKEQKVLADITEKITLDGKHKQTEQIRAYMRQRKYAFMHGNPGAGKSFLAESLASDMEIDFYAISCAPDMFKSELLGSVSPVNGQYIKGLLYEPFKNGGLVLLDEVGLASGAFLNVLNNAMANKSLRFPNGELIRMHANFFLLLADNSTLYGNDPMFPERQDCGQAFRDRIKYVNFEYDTILELKIIQKIMGNERGQKWHITVLAMRKQMKAFHADVPVFVSPRFAYDAASDFVNKRDWNEIIESGLYKGLNGDVHAMISSTINSFKGSF